MLLFPFNLSWKDSVSLSHGRPSILCRLHLAEFILSPSPGYQLLGLGEGKWQEGRDPGCAVSAGLSDLFLSGWGQSCSHCSWEELQREFGREENLSLVLAPRAVCCHHVCPSAAWKRDLNKATWKSLLGWWYSLFCGNVGLAGYCHYCRSALAKCTLWTLMCSCILQ